MEQVLAILEDWNDEAGSWTTSGAEWARRLGVSPSTIHMLRRGETWEHLNHPNQGRRKREGTEQNGHAKAAANGARQNGRRKRNGHA